MQRKLFNAVKDASPKFNKYIKEGFVVGPMKHIAKEADKLFRCAQSQFPEGFIYEGYKICTPQEEWQHCCKPLYGKIRHDLSRSDVFLVKFQFSWQGKEDKVKTMLPPRYIFLPAVGKAGTMHLRGPMFTLSPVMADIALSVANNGLFMPFLRDRITFTRLAYQFKCDSRYISSYIVVAPIHKYAQDKSKKLGVTSCLTHYMLAKYGPVDMFNRFYGTDVEIIHEKDYTPAKYPAKKWICCRSSEIAPRGYERPEWTPHGIYLMVPRSKWTEELSMAVTAFFYVCDYFSHRIAKAEFCLDKRFWRTLLGYIITKKTQVSEGKLLNDANEHIDSLDKYLDDEVKSSLAKTNIFCDTIYELFHYVQNNISDIIMNTNLASNYGKRLMVLRYVLLDLTTKIFHLAYSLSSNRKPLTVNEIIKAMGSHLKRDLVINSLTKSHGEVSVIDSPGDSTITRFTTNVVPQTNATGKRKARGKINLDDPAKLLHVSIAEFCGYANLPKSDPSGRSTLNPYMLCNSDGSIDRNPDFKELLDTTQHYIDGKTSM